MNIRRPLFWNHGDLKSLNTTSAAVPERSIWSLGTEGIWCLLR